MTKDEMKNRISMALKDPILQQCFEIICKENAELKIRITNANLKRLEMQVAKDSHRDRARKAHEQLAKANELIIKLSTCLEGHSNNNFEYVLLKEAFGFLEDDSEGQKEEEDDKDTDGTEV